MSSRQARSGGGATTCGNDLGQGRLTAAVGAQLLSRRVVWLLDELLLERGRERNDRVAAVLVDPRFDFAEPFVLATRIVFHRHVDQIDHWFGRQQIQIV